MDSAVALLTDVNPNIEFFSIKAPGSPYVDEVYAVSDGEMSEARAVYNMRTAAPLSIFASGVIIRCLMSLQQ